MSLNFSGHMKSVEYRQYSQHETCLFWLKSVLGNNRLNSFSTNVPLLYPLKTYKSGTWIENELHNCWSRSMDGQTLKQFVGKLPMNCLSVFDHFVGLALKGLSHLLYAFNCSKCTYHFSYHEANVVRFTEHFHYFLCINTLTK